MRKSLEKWNAKGGDVSLEVLNDRKSLLAIQGPKAAEVLQRLTDVDLSKQPFMSQCTGNIKGLDKEVLICRLGLHRRGRFRGTLHTPARTVSRYVTHTGEDGFEVRVYVCVCVCICLRVYVLMRPRPVAEVAGLLAHARFSRMP